MIIGRNAIDAGTVWIPRQRIRVSRGVPCLRPIARMSLPYCGHSNAGDVWRLDLQSRLNDDGHPIPIIFITAHGDEKMRIRAMRAGAAAFLAKPFDRVVLLERVRACLERT